MPNWYSGLKEPKSRYVGNIRADIFIPSISDEGRENDMARRTLELYLPKDNNASKETGIDATINLNIENISKFF